MRPSSAHPEKPALALHQDLPALGCHARGAQTQQRVWMGHSYGALLGAYTQALRWLLRRKA